MHYNLTNTIMENCQKFMSPTSTEDELERLKVALNTNIEGALKFIREKQNIWKNIPLNIGVTGCSGVGKSTFINTIRGLNGDDEGAAAVEVNEATTVPTAYEHPLNPNLKFWDLPGVGTINFPKENYLKKIEIDSYDFFIDISAGRFTENDGWLANEIEAHGKHLYFVRSQIAVDIEKDKKGHPETHDPGVVVESIRQNMVENLQTLNVHAKFFLIDSYEREKFDFEKLENSLIDDYPNTKRQALILSLTSLSKQIIGKKMEELRKRLLYAATLSAIGAAVPVPGLSVAVDLSIIAEETSFYFKQLGLTKKSLQSTAALFGLDEKVPTTIVQEELPCLSAFCGEQASFDAIKVLVGLIVKQSCALLGAVVSEEVSRFIPIIGCFVCASSSFVATYYILKGILDKFEEVAMKIVKVYCEHH